MWVAVLYCPIQADCIPFSTSSHFSRVSFRYYRLRFHAQALVVHGWQFILAAKLVSSSLRPMRAVWQRLRPCPPAWTLTYLHPTGLDIFYAAWLDSTVSISIITTSSDHFVYRDAFEIKRRHDHSKPYWRKLGRARTWSDCITDLLRATTWPWPKQIRDSNRPVSGMHCSNKYNKVRHQQVTITLAYCVNVSNLLNVKQMLLGLDFRLPARHRAIHWIDLVIRCLETCTRDWSDSKCPKTHVITTLKLRNRVLHHVQPHTIVTSLLQALM